MAGSGAESLADVVNTRGADPALSTVETIGTEAAPHAVSLADLSVDASAALSQPLVPLAVSEPL